MIQAPETIRISSHRISCDGASEIPGGAALGHPKVWLEIDETGAVECGYCDRRFILIGGPAEPARVATALFVEGDKSEALKFQLVVTE